MSELIIVAIVMRPPPPNPVKARMRFRVTTSPATPQPRQPTPNVVVATKNKIRRPKMSLTRPYRGCTAVVVTRYDVVSQDAEFAASNSELMTA